MCKYIINLCRSVLMFDVYVYIQVYAYVYKDIYLLGGGVLFT